MQKLLFAVLLTATTASIYWSTLDFSFVWSDRESIVENRAIHPPSRSGIKRIWKIDTDALYLPVTRTTFAAIAKASQTQSRSEKVAVGPSADTGASLSPKLFHAASVLAHCLNVILVFIILCQMCSGATGPLLGAALFSLHPLQGETVAWISSFGTLLGSLLGLFALWQYLVFSKSSSSQSRGRSNPMRHYYAGTASFVLSILAMPSMVVLGPIAFVTERLLPRERSFLPVRQPLWPVLVWMLLAIPVAGLAIASQSTEALSSQISGILRPLIAGDAFVFYLQKILLPLGIGPDYGRSPSSIITGWWIYAAWSIPAALLFFSLYTRSKARDSMLGFLALLTLGLLPFLGLITFESQSTSTVANRYTYLAMLGPAFAIARLISLPKGVGIPLVTSLAVIGYAYLGSKGISYWKNDQLLWKHAIQINESSPIAHRMLADGFRESQDYDRAKAHYLKVLKSNSTSPEVHFHLAEIEHMQGNVEEARKLYERALKLKPNYAEAHNSLGTMLIDQGAHQAAHPHLLTAVEINNQDSRFLHDLGRNHVQLEHFQEAIPVLRKALQVGNARPKREKSVTQALLGVALGETGRPEMGQIHLETALGLDPKNPMATRRLADLYYSKDRPDAAFPLYERAAKTHDKDADVFVNLGTILLSKQKYKAAKKHFLRAVELKPKSAPIILKLGKTCFHLRQIGEATKYFEEVLGIDRNTADAYYYLGDIARWKGHSEESLALYYKTLSIAKNHPEAHYRLGNYFMIKEKTKQAIWHYSRGLKKSPEHRRLKSSLNRAERKLKSAAM